MENYYYTYETTNLTNGRKYIGQHCTHNMNDDYFGSSKELKEDVKKGHKVKVDIINHHSNIWDLGRDEHKLINERKAVVDPIYYNKTNFLCFNKTFIYGQTDEVKRKVSEALKGRPVWNSGGTNPKAKEWWASLSDEEYKEICRKNSEGQKGRKGVQWTEEQKKQISESCTGIKRSEETKQKMRKPKSPEHIAKMKESAKKGWEKRRKNKQLIGNQKTA